jgi:uncharacterized protein YdeI (YjbR/CyaY-like superfamily)
MHNDEKLKDGKPIVFAGDRNVWREWLLKNHQTIAGIWLVIFKGDSGIPSVRYPEAVTEALCFGWIDSKPNKRDEQSYYQYFAPRNPKSNWSLVNRNKVEKLIAEDRMHESGLKMVELLKPMVHGQHWILWRQSKLL